MIQASELRIGNLIYCVNEKVTNIVKVGFWVIKEIEMDVPRDKSQNSFEPIRLTEEWLNKFGIYVEGISIELGSGTIGVLQNNINGSYKYYLKSAFGMVHLDRIHYVHQLQNLYFSLTGKELTIKE